MSDLPIRSDDGDEPVTLRCPVCDSVIGADDSHCLMCGALLSRAELTADPPNLPPPPAKPQPEKLAVEAAKPQPEEPAEEAAASLPDAAAVETSPGTTASSVPIESAPVMQSPVRERQSLATFWLTAVFTVIIIILSALVLRYQSPNVSVALVPSPTPIPPTATYTPTITPLPTETSPPTATPTMTLTPAPTDTPRPPRYHVVASGETLIGISLRFRIAPEAIASANSFNPEQPIQVSQELVIPWPTATPPLESALIEINNQPALADVTECEIYTIQPDDTAFGIAAARGIPLEAIRAVNRLTREGLELLQPGDTLCLPEIVYTDSLPPTPGPSPTPSMTPLPAGPNLLYPINWAAVGPTGVGPTGVGPTEVGPSDEVARLVWTAVKDLTADEWYMVELTDMTRVDSVPYRGFTRDTAFRLPPEWYPEEDEAHEFRWRVSIVQVMGEREDGRFIYSYGGQQSQPAYFIWHGSGG